MGQRGRYVSRGMPCDGSRAEVRILSPAPGLGDILEEPPEVRSALDRLWEVLEPHAQDFARRKIESLFVKGPGLTDPALSHLPPTRRLVDGQREARVRVSTWEAHRSIIRAVGSSLSSAK